MIMIFCLDYNIQIRMFQIWIFSYSTLHWIESFGSMHCAHAATRGSVVPPWTRHSQAQYPRNADLQSLFTKTSLFRNIFLTCVSERSAFREDPARGEFLNLKPRQWWCCWFVGQQRTHLIPPPLPPLPKSLCSQRPQSVSEPSFTCIQEKWKNRKKPVKGCVLC